MDESVERRSAEHHTTNRAHWDSLAAFHGQDDYYDSRALAAGQSSLTEEEERALALTMDELEGMVA